MSQEPLRFALILRLIVERTCRSWNDAAQKCHLPEERLIKMAQGQHEPRAGDVLRIQDGLKIRFHADDFEKRGMA